MEYQILSDKSLFIINFKLLPDIALLKCEKKMWNSDKSFEKLMTDNFYIIF